MLSLIMQGCITWVCIANRSAEYHQVDPNLLIAIIQVESSGCKKIYNRRSNDYGCGQINKVHLQGFRDMQMFSDPKFSIPVAAYLLKKAKQKPCVYHLGTAGKKKFTKACEAYTIKVRKELHKRR